MKDTYFTLKGDSQILYKDKGSKFHAFAYHVEDIDSIKEILEVKRKEYYDARHVCYAYMLGTDRLIYRANDDGEPSGTAGKPILGQINSFDLTDVLIVVVRYFGGTLLGTSGLIHAYKTSAFQVIEEDVIEEKIIENYYQIDFPYEFMNAIQRVIKDFDLTIVNQKFEIACSITFKVRLTIEEQVLEKLSHINYTEAIKLKKIEINTNLNQE